MRLRTEAVDRFIYQSLYFRRDISAAVITHVSLDFFDRNVYSERH